MSTRCSGLSARLPEAKGLGWLERQRPAPPAAMRAGEGCRKYRSCLHPAVFPEWTCVCPPGFAPVDGPWSHCLPAASARSGPELVGGGLSLALLTDGDQRAQCQPRQHHLRGHLRRHAGDPGALQQRPPAPGASVLTGEAPSPAWSAGPRPPSLRPSAGPSQYWWCCRSWGGLRPRVLSPPHLRVASPCPHSAPLPGASPVSRRPGAHRHGPGGRACLTLQRIAVLLLINAFPESAVLAFGEHGSFSPYPSRLRLWAGTVRSHLEFHY